MQKPSNQRMIRVLQSAKAPQAGNTTFGTLLELGRDRGDSVMYFDWRTALRGDYDVFHVHWPEHIVRGRGRKDYLVNLLRFPLLMLRLSVRRVGVVRTVHNLHPHEDGYRIEKLFVRWLERRTDVWVRINDTTELGGRPNPMTALHPHYRHFLADAPDVRPDPNRLLYFGIIRPFKGVESLVEAFQGIDDAQQRLRVVGRVIDKALAARITAAGVADQRISSRLEHLSDDDLVEEILGAGTVVLPYRTMHNSGSLLLALSLGRRVVVPRNDVNESIAREVGPGWVHLYDGTIGAATLAQAQAYFLSDPPVAATPDLDRRDPAIIADRYDESYRLALARRRRNLPESSA